MSSQPTRKLLNTHVFCFIAMLIACNGGNNGSDQSSDIENTEAACQDNIDNDMDGLTDCTDEECSDWPFCAENNVPNEVINSDTETVADADSDSESSSAGDTDADTATDIGSESDSDGDTNTDTKDGALDGGVLPCFGPVVIAAEARACDLLLDVGNNPVASVRFSGDTRGATIQRPPRLAISMVTAGDTSFSEAPVCLEGEISHVTLAQATCYDRLGRLLAGESAVLP